MHLGRRDWRLTGRARHARWTYRTGAAGRAGRTGLTLRTRLPWGTGRRIDVNIDVAAAEHAAPEQQQTKPHQNNQHDHSDNGGIAAAATVGYDRPILWTHVILP